MKPENPCIKTKKLKKKEEEKRNRTQGMHINLQKFPTTIVSAINDSLDKL